MIMGRASHDVPILADNRKVFLDNRHLARLANEVSYHLQIVRFIHCEEHDAECAW